MITCRTSGCDVNGRSARSSIGTPRMARNCFGSPGPARTPAPAATTTTPMSGGEAPGELTDSLQPDHFQVLASFRPARQKHATKPLARGFCESALDARNRTDLATEADLAEKERIRRNRAIVNGRNESGENGQVGRGFDETHTTGDVDEHIQTAERQAGAALEDGEQQREPALIESRRDALRSSE